MWLGLRERHDIPILGGKRMLLIFSSVLTMGFRVILAVVMDTTVLCYRSRMTKNCREIDRP